MQVNKTSFTGRLGKNQCESLRIFFCFFKGYIWEDVTLKMMVKIKFIAAQGVFEEKGHVWLLSSTNDVFCIAADSYERVQVGVFLIVLLSWNFFLWAGCFESIDVEHNLHSFSTRHNVGAVGRRHHLRPSWSNRFLSRWYNMARAAASRFGGLAAGLGQLWM